MTDREKELARRMGAFYYEYMLGDKSDAERYIHNLRIRGISLSEDGATLTVTTKRPGLFIGKRGQNIDKLVAFLGVKLKVVEPPPDVEDAMEIGAMEAAEMAGGEDVRAVRDGSDSVYKGFMGEDN